jgi:PIN domain nuclease of toxin-antitoxin system
VAPVILLDTHVVVWLYGGQRGLIPSRVQRRLNAEQLGVSPFVQLELAYLYEIGRVRSSAQEVIDELSARLDLVVVDVGARAVCNAALRLTWTRDPFDRLLVAHAMVTGLALVTKDETIRHHLPLAWWTD